MKRWIKASNIINPVIFEDENFIFCREHGVGINNTPWYGLKVRTKNESLAYKHVVEIRLITSNSPKFEGDPVCLTYRGAEVAHGIRSTRDSLDDTKEYIEVLEDALDFAYRVNDWLYDNDEGAIDIEDIDLEINDLD